MDTINLAIGETGWNPVARFYGKVTGKFKLIRGSSIKSRVQEYTESGLKIDSFNIFCDSIAGGTIRVKSGYGLRKNVTLDMSYSLALMLDELLDDHSFIRLNTNKYDGNDMVVRMVSAYHACPVVLAVQQSPTRCTTRVYAAPSVCEKFSDGLFDGVHSKYTDAISNTWDFDFPGHDIVDWIGLKCHRLGASNV